MIVKVVKAEYKNDYKLNIYFSDGVSKLVDFGPFLEQSKGFLEKYKKLSQFKKFRIEDGNVVWGKNWDLIFPIDHLYSGTIRN